MRLPLIVLLIVMTALSGCGKVRDSKLNPFNWFGRAQPVVAATLYTAPTDARALVAQVLTLKVEPYPGGAIVRATGLPPTQGYWEAALVALPVDDKGRLVYEFRIFPPLVATPVGTPYARQVTVAASVSDIKLQGVSSIVVQGAANALSSRR